MRKTLVSIAAAAATLVSIAAAAATLGGGAAQAQRAKPEDAIKYR
jgi:hypothetical protein